jgi:hypothetical protein
MDVLSMCVMVFEKDRIAVDTFVSPEGVKTCVYMCVYM